MLPWDEFGTPAGCLRGIADRLDCLHSRRQRAWVGQTGYAKGEVNCAKVQTSDFVALATTDKANGD